MTNSITKMLTYGDVIDALTEVAHLPVRQLQTTSGRGCVAMAQAAGRVVAMAFSADGPNLFWSNPQLRDHDVLRKVRDRLVFGYGGDRLWFAPEVDYNWDGKPQWDTLANYKVPASADPGAYRFAEAGLDSIKLQSEGELPIHGSDNRVAFKVERTVRFATAPLKVDDPLMKGVDYVGIETSHSLKTGDEAKAGRLGLWHLLQVPVGSVLLVPLNPTATVDQKRPLSYALPGSWEQKEDHILLKYCGEARAKFGLPAIALTGRTAVLRQLAPGRWCLLVRQFPVDANARFADYPFGIPRNDQLFQAWDGCGFGEMEYHSPMLDLQQGVRELKESDQIWAFGGRAPEITAIAHRLLKIDISQIVALAGN